MNERLMFRTPYFIDGKFIGYIFWNNRGGLCPEPPQDSTYGNDEQCTGLKDKNGKLIYEKDTCLNSSKKKGIIKFGYYTLCAGDPHECCEAYGFYWEQIGLTNQDYPHGYESASDILEIISNIHTDKGE